MALENAPVGAPRWRIVAALVAVGALLAFSGYVFWLQDWKYGLPTPRPADLTQAPIGSAVALPPALAGLRAQAAGRPLFLHFFNPDCPCSRFTQDHISALVHAHHDAVMFAAIVESDDDGGAVDAAAVAKTGRALGISALGDSSGAIGRALGVYATPQAVILRADGTIFYRGNYNTSRYCADAQTEFARLSLEHLLAGRPFAAPEAASVAYGCALPEGHRQ